MSINSCKDCKDRYVGCHSTCEKYINAKKEYDELQEKIKKSKYRENDLNFVSSKKHIPSR